MSGLEEDRVGRDSGGSGGCPAALGLWFIWFDSNSSENCANGIYTWIAYNTPLLSTNKHMPDIWEIFMKFSAVQCSRVYARLDCGRPKSAEHKEQLFFVAYTLENKKALVLALMSVCALFRSVGHNFHCSWLWWITDPTYPDMEDPTTQSTHILTHKPLVGFRLIWSERRHRSRTPRVSATQVGRTIR